MVLGIVVIMHNSAALCGFPGGHWGKRVFVNTGAPFIPRRRVEGCELRRCQWSSVIHSGLRMVWILRSRLIGGLICWYVLRVARSSSSRRGATSIAAGKTSTAAFDSTAEAARDGCNDEKNNEGCNNDCSNDRPSEDVLT